MKVDVLSEDDKDGDTLKHKCLCMYVWGDSIWDRDNYSVLIIKDIPKTITTEQFNQLCQISSINNNWDIKWLLAMQIKEVDRLFNYVVVTWKEVVEQLLSGDNDFEG